MAKKASLGDMSLGAERFALFNFVRAGDTLGSGRNRANI